LKAVNEKCQHCVEERYMEYDIQKTDIGPILAGIDDEGLRYVSFQQGKHPMPIPEVWTQNERLLKPVFDQIQAYLNGELTCFDLTLAPMGTQFQKSVWAALLEIPYGKTASYGDIATAIGNPKACRAVGGANGRNPIPLIIPCHRIIGIDGKLVGYGSGLPIKKKLLALESKYYHRQP
jgi:methylated-DNA-[protein]-cysteine S-methyltransferase